MIKCHKCGTGWTSQGLPLCPICGAKVENPAAAAPVLERTAVEAAPRKSANGSAVLEAPPEPPKFQLHKVEPAAPVNVVKHIEALCEPLAEPSKAKAAEPAVEPPTPKPEPATILQTVVLKPSPAIVKPATELRRPEPPAVEAPLFSDPSAISLPAMRMLPTSPRPLNGPLVLGALAYVGVFLLPLSLAFESHRVFGVLGFCMAAFFAPFAPIAWMAGLAAEKRRREQGLRPENPVQLGRLLGQWATMILVSEVTLALIGIAALRLAGRFPVTFWAPFY